MQPSSCSCASGRMQARIPTCTNGSSLCRRPTHFCLARTPLSNTRCSSSALASAQAIEDPWIETFSAATAPSSSGLPQLNDVCREAMATLRMPTLRNEEYRFTELAPLTQASVFLPEGPSDAQVASWLADVERYE